MSETRLGPWICCAALPVSETVSVTTVVDLVCYRKKKTTKNGAITPAGAGRAR